MKTASPMSKHRPLLLAALALIALPFGLQALGLSLNTGIMVVALTIAAMGLNLCVGYTGLVSFGHGTWFGIGAYAAGLMQLNWFRGDIWLPLLLSMVMVAVASTIVGVVILRRRGVYFSLLTLALAALSYTIAFRWSNVTGGDLAYSNSKSLLYIADKDYLVESSAILENGVAKRWVGQRPRELDRADHRRAVAVEMVRQGSQGGGEQRRHHEGEAEAHQQVGHQQVPPLGGGRDGGEDRERAGHHDGPRDHQPTRSDNVIQSPHDRTEQPHQQPARQQQEADGQRFEVQHLLEHQRRGDDGTEVEHGDRLAHLHDQGDIVLDHQDGEAVAHQRAQEVGELVGLVVVEAQPRANPGARLRPTRLSTCGVLSTASSRSKSASRRIPKQRYSSERTRVRVVAGEVVFIRPR